jgi:cytochrome oxidase assembly protein ShyY1
MNNTKTKLTIAMLISINILLLSLGIWQIKRGIDKGHNQELYYANINANLSANDLLRSLFNKEFNENILYKNISLNNDDISITSIENPIFFIGRSINGVSGYFVANSLIMNKIYRILYVHDFIKLNSKQSFISLAELQNMYANKYANINIVDNVKIIKNIPRVFVLSNNSMPFDNKTPAIIVQNITPKILDKVYTDNKLNVPYTLIANRPDIPLIDIGTKMTKDKHYGYAITWFGLCLVSFVFTCIMFKRNKKKQL